MDSNSSYLFSDSKKCFVPNCSNTVGVPFPENVDQKRQWLESLKITEVEPKPSSFICLDHFEENYYLNEEVDSETEISIRVKLKEDAIPTILSPKENCENIRNRDIQLQQVKEAKVIKEINQFLEENYVQSDISQEEKQNTSNTFEPTQNNNNYMKIENDLNCGNFSEDSMTAKNRLEERCTYGETKMCRLCMSMCQPEDTQNIYEKMDDNILIVNAITACIWPLKITKHDKLSKEICNKCLDKIKNYYLFRSLCLGMDEKQQELLDLDTACDTDYTDSDSSDGIENFLIKNDIKSKEATYTDIKIRKKDIDKTFDKVEEELRRVLEGQLTEEQINAENIIIQVENEEDNKTENKLAKLSPLRLPLIIKPLGSNGSQNLSPLSNKRKIEGDEKLRSVKIKKEYGVSLPKGIHIKNVNVNQKYQSEVGIYEGFSKQYLFGAEFCVVDGYLYEYRLCKGNVRYLHCILQTCPSVAVQNKVGPGVYSSEITVQKAHNHKATNALEKKKQMFYYVMKRKLQTDKSLNLKHVYEEICKKDAEIKELVPLKNVINEICRHQLASKMPEVHNFDQFYNQIEDDSFEKLHFTNTGKQFYQEKFMAEDGDSKAIVFANVEVIDQVSMSKLMYIDSSFKIDSSPSCKFQLVTVLVWVDESYYPILYALVNRKTQEIYKKIFGFLHNHLAPHLQPEEIVTDYEANLYYALGETYLNSHIGGSVFYFTQNLYKKICALKLSREMETNSYFRNIYHMLLMLPLLPVNTILDGLNNIETQAKELGLNELMKDLFEHVHTQWLDKVTPELFCVHRLENRINENVIAPFKKLRDFLMLSKGKMQKNNTSVVHIVEKLIDLEYFLQTTYATPNKKSFARDLSSSQKKNVLKAWQYIETHPKINLNSFFTKVLGYIKCMENQLWIWGFYRFNGEVEDDLINATNFSIISNELEVASQTVEDTEEIQEEYYEEFDDNEGVIEEEMETEYGEETNNVTEDGAENESVVMEAVIDENGSFVLQNNVSNVSEDNDAQFDSTFLKYVYK